MEVHHRREPCHDLGLGRRGGALSKRRQDFQGDSHDGGAEGL